jgi:hypothetical protein
VARTAPEHKAKSREQFKKSLRWFSGPNAPIKPQSQQGIYRDVQQSRQPLLARKIRQVEPKTLATIRFLKNQVPQNPVQSQFKTL